MGMLCVPTARTARQLLPVLLFVVWAAGCGGEGPTRPSSLLGPHKVVYLIYLSDVSEVAFRQAEFPSGVSGRSPEEAAREFRAPIKGQVLDASFHPPGILIPDQGYNFDETKSRGTLPTSGTEYEWVGYFYCPADRPRPCP